MPNVPYHHPPTATRRQAILLPALLALLLMPAARAQDTDHGFAYNWQPGTAWVFERRDTTTTLDTHRIIARHDYEVRIWCLAADSEQALVLLELRTTDTGTPDQTRGVLLQVTPAGRPNAPAGVARRVPALAPALELLPALPLPVQHTRYWRAPPNDTGLSWECRGQGPDPTRADAIRVAFELNQPPALKQLNPIEHAGSFWFDHTLKHITGLQSTRSDPRANTRTDTVARWVNTLEHGPAWAMRRAAEAEIYLRSIRHENYLLAQVLNQPDQFERTTHAIDQLWAGFASDVDSRAMSPFERIAAGQRQLLRESRSKLQTRAALGQRWLNQPARLWTLTDPAGNQLISEHVRVGVTVEFFWAADQPDSVRALDAFRQLHAHLHRGPITFIAYNLDINPARAQQALALCHDRFTHIVAGPLQLAAPLPELPIVRVVDAAGIVRGLWLGWQPNYQSAATLAADLADYQPP